MCRKVRPLRRHLLQVGQGIVHLGHPWLLLQFGVTGGLEKTIGFGWEKPIGFGCCISGKVIEVRLEKYNPLMETWVFFDPAIDSFTWPYLIGVHHQGEKYPVFGSTARPTGTAQPKLSACLSRLHLWHLNATNQTRHQSFQVLLGSILVKILVKVTYESHTQKTKPVEKSGLVLQRDGLLWCSGCSIKSLDTLWPEPNSKRLRPKTYSAWAAFIIKLVLFFKYQQETHSVLEMLFILTLKLKYSTWYLYCTSVAGNWHLSVFSQGRFSLVGTKPLHHLAEVPARRNLLETVFLPFVMDYQKMFVHI